MHREDRVSDGPLSPCGHRNPPTSHFCDVCGVRLPVPCPRCHTVNRSEANFCGLYGIDLRVVRTEPLSAPRETSGPATHAETDDKSEPESVDPLSWTPGSGDMLVEGEPGDAARLERISRFLHRPRRVWPWLPTVSLGAVVGLLIAALIHTHLPTPSGDEHPPSGLSQTSAQGESRPEPLKVGLREDHHGARCLLPRRRRRRPSCRPTLVRAVS